MTAPPAFSFPRMANRPAMPYRHVAGRRTSGVGRAGQAGCASYSFTHAEKSSVPSPCWLID